MTQTHTHIVSKYTGNQMNRERKHSREKTAWEEERTDFLWKQLKDILHEFKFISRPFSFMLPSFPLTPQKSRIYSKYDVLSHYFTSSYQAEFISYNSQSALLLRECKPHMNKALAVKCFDDERGWGTVINSLSTEEQEGGYSPIRPSGRSSYRGLPSAYLRHNVRHKHYSIWTKEMFV